MSWDNMKPAVTVPWNAANPPSPIAEIAAVTDNPLHQMYGHMDKDMLLMEWQKCKDAIETAKEAEMNMRKYIVFRAFPEKKEGTNTLALGNGYELKAGIKYNYKITVSNEKLDDCLDRISKIGNTGAFIVDRLISWSPSFLLTEYRNLQTQSKEGDKTATDILTVVSEFLEVNEAAPSLDIKEPKKAKGK